MVLGHISEAYSSQTCPACNHRTKVRGREYVCKNTICGFRLHRDAVGGVNISDACRQRRAVPPGPRPPRGGHVSPSPTRLEPSPADTARLPPQRPRTSRPGSAQGNTA
ncbi:zinc ribbon domain-containing protein [Actinacidiphila soli]|uniref:zinc ribbon domain-containing protein n=1 Tax=Actinacidiphila soli TaxID=2487275 RepID=UPI000FCA4EFA